MQVLITGFRKGEQLFKKLEEKSTTPYLKMSPSTFIFPVFIQ